MDFVFYLTLFFFVLLFGALDNSIDYDFFARLIVGKSFFQTGELFKYDFYSYGTTHNFIDHEWGSSLIFYLIQHNFSDIGLYIFKSAIIFLTLFIVTKIIRLDKSDAKFHFLFFFFAIQSICYTFFSTIRCQSFSFLFFVAYLYILKHSLKYKNYRVLFCLPLLNIIWQNLHGGFVLGLALIVIFIIGEYLNNNKKFSKVLSISFLITLLGMFVNPYGLKYITFIFEAYKLNRIHIIEWQSAFFNHLFIFQYIKFKIFFAVCLILFIFSIVKSLKLYGIKSFYQKIDKTKYLLIIFCTIISLLAQRCHPFLALSIIALCYNNFYQIFNKKLSIGVDNLKEIILLIIITISSLSHIYNYKFINTLNERFYPVRCIEFIKINKIKGNVFCNFHIGSYGAYKLYPDNLIFMDGRYEETYDVNLINEMGDFFLNKYNGSFLKKYKSDILIIENFYPVKKALDNDKNWFLAYSDENFSLYLPKEYKRNEGFILPNEDKNYYFKTKFETNIDWLK